MQKIKLMTDSTSDIDPELEQSLDIQILCFPVTVDGCRVSFGNYQEIKVINKASKKKCKRNIKTFFQRHLPCFWH